jgi:carbon-monoxide dehydrogenase medium subunit
MHAVQRVHALPPTYVAPQSLGSALDLLAEYQERARIVAGGTDLVLEIQRGARTGIDVLIDITRVEGLDSIGFDSGTLHVGPLATHGDVAAHPIVSEHAAPLAQACREIGAPALRNRATVAGNVVTASPANDTLSALVALDASVTLRSAARTRTLPVDRFVTGHRTTALEPDEMVAAITVPALNPRQRGVFVKLGNRRAQAISVVHLTAVVELDGAFVTSARLVAGSVGPSVVPLHEAAARLVGHELSDATAAEAADVAAAEIAPIDDIRATATYREHGLRVMVRRALASLRADAVAGAQPAPRLGRVRTLPASGRTLRTGDTITATVNGTTFSASGAADTTLLAWLRERAHLTGTKEGCAEGECGACTVVLDGGAVLSCLVPAGRADGASIVTVEGLASGAELHRVQQGFLDGGGVQCGFCTPGFLVSGAALLADEPAPAPTTVSEAFAGNLCRCTGYHRILASMEAATS